MPANTLSQSSILVSEQTSGRCVKTSYSVSPDADTHSGMQRIIEGVELCGARLRVKPLLLTAVSTADSNDLSTLIYPGSFIWCGDGSKLYVSVRSSASGGLCTITPIIYDAGQNTWKANTMYNVGDWVTPNINYGSQIGCMTNFGGMVAECTASTGYSGATEPYWNQQGLNSNFFDNNVTWTTRYRGRLLGTLTPQVTTASTTMMTVASTGKYMCPLQSWDIAGAWIVFPHISALTASSNVDVVAWVI